MLYCGNLNAGAITNGLVRSTAITSSRRIKTQDTGEFMVKWLFVILSRPSSYFHGNIESVQLSIDIANKGKPQEAQECWSRWSRGMAKKGNFTTARGAILTHTKNDLPKP